MTMPEHLLRDLAPQVLGAVVRRHRDFAAAEDAVQEALIAAADQWPREGVPLNPRAWLIKVAMRRLTDQVRSEVARRRRESAMIEEEEPVAPAETAGDDTLLLLFMCCHPALTHTSAIALTLRAVGGLTTASIARAFFVPEATMAQRISRAKQSVQNSGVGFEMPEIKEQAERLGAVLHTLYLIFNEGYAASSGDSLQRIDLSNEAIRLTRALHHIMPEDPEITGLLALMLLTDARRDARVGAAGEIIPLDEQDRSRWNKKLIEEGVAMISDALTRGAVGPYQLQAAIAAIHDEASSTEATDWPQILAFYGLLEKITKNPTVTLNRAVALAMVEGPTAGLKLLKSIENDERVSAGHRLDAIRGHFYEMAGQRTKAITHYRRAAERTANTPERNYLLLKAARLECS